MDENDTLPSILSEMPEIELPEAIDLNPEDGELEAKKADLPIANTMMRVVHACWGEVKSISGVHKMLKMTIEATKHRRDVLGIQYGPKTGGEAKSGMVYPLD